MDRSSTETTTAGMSRRDRWTVVAWRWGGLFEPDYCHRLQAGLARHLHVDHELVVVTDDPVGLEGIRTVPMPTTYADTPRCRRRMQQFSREFGEQLGATRYLGVDLDIVITGDITPIVTKFPDAPIVGWRVGYAGVYSGSFLRFDTGALHGAWELFAADPEGYPASLQLRGVPSDQAMVNAWLATQPAIAEWTEADGFVTYFGAGYERFAYLGVGPSRPELPHGARIVVLGSADKAVMDRGEFDWIRRHWGPPLSQAVPA
jgi:hypothetical protein